MEFDTRFEKEYPREFIFFDYTKRATENVQHLFNKCGWILADPPHLNPDCIALYMETITRLSFPTTTTNTAATLKRTLSVENMENDPTDENTLPNACRNTWIVFITGQVLHEEMEGRYKFHVSPFLPSFTSKLSNAFTTYSNYNPTQLQDAQDKTNL